MADAASVAGWPAFVARPFVCGALGEIDAGALERVLRAGPAVGEVHVGDGVVLHGGPNVRRAGAHFGFGQVAPPPTGDWMAAAEATEAPGLVDGRDEVVVHAGALGLVDLHYRVHNGAAYFASRIEPLLALGPDAVDWAAWAAILRLGCPLGDATPFAGVKRLGAASALVWSRSRRRLRVERRQHRAIAAARGEANAGDVLDAVRSAMEVCAGRASILPLSGGWDSRLLAGIAAARGFELEAWTTCPDSGRGADVDFARRVAEALGLAHRVFTPEDAGADYRDYAHGVWRRLEYQTAYHAWLGPLTSRLHQERRPVVDGLGGDVLVKGLFVKRAVLEAEPGRPRRAALFAAMSAAPASVLSPRVEAWVDDQVRADFDCATEDVRGHRAEESLAVLVTRSARAIACSPFSLFGPELAVDVPFVAPQVLEAALAIDPWRKLDGRFYREVLVAASPAVAALPSTNDAAVPRGGGARRQTSPAALGWKHSILSDLDRRIPSLLHPDLAAALDTGPDALRRLSAPMLARLSALGLWLAENSAQLGGLVPPPGG